jgi:hypothetical protein
LFEIILKFIDKQTFFQSKIYGVRPKKIYGCALVEAAC